MSWCEVNRVAELITLTYFGTDNTQRSQADCELRKLREVGINFGDSLVEIIVGGPSVPMEVQFAAAMLLEGMCTKQVWLEGTSFSDKPQVTQRLIGLLMHPLLQHFPAGGCGTDLFCLLDATKNYRQTIESVIKSVSLLCALEFVPASADAPNPPWVTICTSMLHEALTGASGTAFFTSNCQRCLISMAGLGRQNTDMWKWLATVAVQQCLNSVATMSADQLSNFLHPVSSFVVALSAALASKTPVDPAVFSTPLFGAAFVSLMLQLQQTLGRLEGLWSLPVTSAQELRILDAGCRSRIQVLTFLIHAPKRENVHRAVLDDTIRTLTTLGKGYLEISLGPSSGQDERRAQSLTAVITEMLEAVQAILEALPSALQWVCSTDLFHAFVWFTVESDETVRSNAAEEEIAAALLNLVESEDVTLAGCGSGAPRAVVGSIMQLCLEHDMDAIFDLVRAWSGMASGLLQEEVANPVKVHTNDPFWCALLGMLTSMTQQCAANNVSLADYDTECESLVLHPLTTKLQSVLSAPSVATELSYHQQFMASLVVHAIASTLNLSTNTSMCHAAVQFLIGIIEREGSKQPTATPVASIGLRAVTSIITASPDVCSSLTDSLPPSIMECALWVTCSNSSSLGPVCGGYALGSLLDIGSDGWVETLWKAGAPRLIPATRAMVQCCDTAMKVRVLTALLKALIDSHHTAVRSSHSDASHRCRGLQAVLEVIHNSVGSNRGPNASLVLRSLFESLPSFLAASLDLRAGGCSCFGAIGVVANDVFHFAQHDGPHDDTTTRGLAVCIGHCMASGAQPPAGVVEHLFSALSGSDGTAVQGQTLSNVCLCLAIGALQQLPREFRPASHLPQDATLFLPNTIQYVFSTIASLRRAQRLKDLNVTGAFLYPAVCCAFAPQHVVEALGVELQQLGANRDQSAMAEYFGLWASLLLFCDRRTQLFTLIGWYRLLQHVLGGGASQDVAAAFMHPFPSNTFRKLRAIHEKHEKLLVPSCSVVKCIIFGLADVSFTSGNMFSRLTNFASSGSPIFDEALSPNRRTLVTEDPISSSLLCTTSSEGALQILNLLATVNQEVAHIVNEASAAVRAAK